MVLFYIFPLGKWQFDPFTDEWGDLGHLFSVTGQMELKRKESRTKSIFNTLNPPNHYIDFFFLFLFIEIILYTSYIEKRKN